MMMFKTWGYIVCIPWDRLDRACADTLPDYGSGLDFHFGLQARPLHERSVLFVIAKAC